MRIAVLVKYVPDATGERTFGADGTVDRAASDGLLCELDEYAVEQALRLAEQAAPNEVDVVAVTLGPGAAVAAVKRALQMGCTSGVHIADEAVHGSDVLGTSTILAAAVTKLGADLVICGMASTDGATGVLPALLAERLGWPGATLASSVTLHDHTVTICRDTDTARLTVEADLPAVVSVTDQSGEVRYPSMKGILAAKKKPVQTWSLADLQLVPESVGLSAAWTRVVDTTARPAKRSGQVVLDSDGTGAAALVEFLAAGRYV